MTAPCNCNTIAAPSGLNQQKEGKPVADNWKKQEAKIGDNTEIGQNSSNILEFYENRSIFITGGNGFIGKVVIEKLLRTCTGVNHIFLLIRAKRGKKPQERLETIFGEELFDLVRYKVDLSAKVIAVQGDITEPNLGLREQDLVRLKDEVSIVYHIAATIRFIEPIEVAIKQNVVGTKNVVDMCRKLPKLAGLVHVSTAFANTDKDWIDEHVYPVAEDPEVMIELSELLDTDTLKHLTPRFVGVRPNTYTYTKALAEWWLFKCARDLPVAICRPSIVVASWKEPFAGWLDNMNGPTGMVMGEWKGVIRSVHMGPSCAANLVPVDSCASYIIVLGWFAHVYHKMKQKDEVAQNLTVSESVEVLKRIQLQF